jgi:hypothetical protein
VTQKVSVDVVIDNINQVNRVINQHGATPLPAETAVQLLAVRSNLAIASALLVLADAVSSNKRPPADDGRD